MVASNDPSLVGQTYLKQALSSMDLKIEQRPVDRLIRAHMFTELRQGPGNWGSRGLADERSGASGEQPSC
jgi:hypothetical protein